MNTLQFGMYDAIACCNEGNISRCMILKLFDHELGFNCVTTMKTLDARRVARAEKV